MAFSARNLSVLAYANGFTLWLYKTRDRLGDIGDDRYFDAAAADLLAHGDVVMVAAADGARIASASIACGACVLSPVH